MPSQFKQKRVCRDRGTSVELCATLGKKGRCNAQTSRVVRPHQTSSSTATNLVSGYVCAIRYSSSVSFCYQGGLLQRPLKWVSQRTAYLKTEHNKSKIQCGSLTHTCISLSVVLSFDYQVVCLTYGIKTTEWKKFYKEFWDCLNCHSWKLKKKTASFDSSSVWFWGLIYALPSTL